MRIMAIDYGDARTGVALSDPTGFLAGQTFLIKSRKEDVVLEELAALAQKQGAEELVMGYPRNMDGTLGPRAEKYAAFAERLKERTGLPLTLWDERRTTVEAHRILGDQGVRAKPSCPWRKSPPPAPRCPRPTFRCSERPVLSATCPIPVRSAFSDR